MKEAPDRNKRPLFTCASALVLACALGVTAIFSLAVAQNFAMERARTVQHQVSFAFYNELGHLFYLDSYYGEYSPEILETARQSALECLLPVNAFLDAVADDPDSLLNEEDLALSSQSRDWVLSFLSSFEAFLLSLPSDGGQWSQEELDLFARCITLLQYAHQPSNGSSLSTLVLGRDKCGFDPLSELREAV